MFVVLHGQTEWNRDGRLQGQRDSPLTELGKSQSRKAALTIGELTGSDARALRPISSPLGRTLQTANILTSALSIALPIETDPRIAEMALGAWEGLTRDQIAARWPELAAGTTRNTSYFHAPGAETFEALGARVGDWLAAHRDHARLVVVTHGIASRVLRGLYCGMSRDEMVDLDVARDAVYRLEAGTVTKF
jgi:broad specificity phosphatase PhoE